MYLGPVVSMMLGLTVGASEILSRYRDEPFTAVFTLPGICYLFLNGAVSLIAYLLLTAYGSAILPGVSKDHLFTSIVAGLSSMVIMRSKLFTLRTDNGEEYGVGPDAIIQTFLNATDRQIDRFRSQKRQKLVYEACKKIKNPAIAPDFFTIAIASFQNLSDSEKRELKDIIERLKEQKLETRLLLMSIAFGFLNIAGEANFAQLMIQLQDFGQKAD